ncbi:hypothetical protein [Mycobacterium intracellulare]|uniref:hypothetical protein n=1 Tax=Mycobacterium intracellulare TaxID=1767 RepID=UPI000CE53EEC|nr:hypothetical protein [Mycobacterium intracellulare]
MEERYGYSFDTRRFRFWWSGVGLLLWPIIILFAVIDHDGWLWEFLFALEVAWMVSCFVIMGREMRDRHRAIRAHWDAVWAELDRIDRESTT